MKEPPSLRVLTAPLRFVWGMAMWAVFLLLSPVLLVFGARGWHSFDEPGTKCS